MVNKKYLNLLFLFLLGDAWHFLLTQKIYGASH